MQCKIQFIFIQEIELKIIYQKYKVKKQIYTVCENSLLVGPNLEALDSNLIPIIENFPLNIFLQILR